jgi:PiT family inorganic phosphate transporter
VDWTLITIVLLVAAALIFDFTKGFHDAANCVGTVVATGALPARLAPAFSVFFNFLALFVVGTAVASTVAKTVKTEFAGEAVIFAALFSAISWNYITWYFGMPSSSSHAIIGGLAGAGLAAGGFSAISWSSVEKAAIGIVASPVVAIMIAFFAMYLIYLLQKIFKLHDNHPTFKGLQLVSAAGLSFGHGANDAQKTIGVIGALLLGAGYTTSADGKNIAVPTWVELAAYTAIALGTLWGAGRSSRRWACGSPPCTPTREPRPTLAPARRSSVRPRWAHRSRRPRRPPAPSSAPASRRERVLTGRSSARWSPPGCSRSRWRPASPI